MIELFNLRETDVDHRASSGEDIVKHLWQTMQSLRAENHVHIRRARQDGFTAGIAISASHNSWEDNGVKVFGHNGYKLSDDLEARIEAGLLPPVVDLGAAARFVIETIAIWAVHMHWDPSPQHFAPDAAEDTVVELLVRALAGSVA